MIRLFLLLLYSISLTNGASRMVCTMQEDKYSTPNCLGSWTKWTSCPSANHTDAAFLALLDSEIKDRKIMFPDFLREVLQNKMMSARQAAIDMRKKNGLPMTQCVRFRLRRSKRSISEDLLAKIVSRHVRQAVNSTTNGTNTTTTSVPTTTTSVPTTTKPTTAPANVYAQAAQQVRDTIVSVVTQIFDALTPLLKNGPLVDIQAIQAHQLLQGLSVQLGMMLGSASAVLQGKPMTPDMDFCNCSAQKQSSSNNSYPPPSNGVNGDDYELLKDNATGSCVDAAADGKPLMACGMCVRKFRACSDKYSIWYDQKTDSQTCETWAPACHVAPLADGSCNYQSYMPTPAPAGKMSQSSYDLLQSKLKSKWTQMLGTTTPMVTCIKAASMCFCCCGDNPVQFSAGIFGCGQPSVATAPPLPTVVTSAGTSPTPTLTPTPTPTPTTVVTKPANATSPSMPVTTPSTGTGDCSGTFLQGTAGCTTNCTYSNRWAVQNSTVSLTLPAPTAPMTCTGVGFSIQNVLMNADFLFACLSANKTMMFHMMFIANGTGTAPIMTPPLITTTYNASAQTVTFSRPLNMSYASMLPINKCLYLIFPVGGATVVNMSVSLNSPVVFTPSPMCLHLCGGGSGDHPTMPMTATSPMSVTPSGTASTMSNVTTTTAMANTTRPANVTATTQAVPALNGTIPTVTTTTTAKPNCLNISYNTTKCRNGSLSCMYSVASSVQGGFLFVTITTNNIGPNRWTGVGINPRPDMVGIEGLIIMMTSDGNFNVSQMQLDSMVSIAQLPKDSQNITLIAASYINGVLKAMLSRYTKAKPVQANRPYDLTTGTYYMLYPFSGGAVLNGLPQYHELMPDVTPVPYSFAGAGC